MLSLAKRIVSFIVHAQMDDHQQVACVLTTWALLSMVLLLESNTFPILIQNMNTNPSQNPN
jgi:hypothetical protein